MQISGRIVYNVVVSASVNTYTAEPLWRDWTHLTDEFWLVNMLWNSFFYNIAIAREFLPVMIYVISWYMQKFISVLWLKIESQTKILASDLNLA